MSQERLLVTGASGQLGRRVLRNLLDRGAPHVIAVSREPAALAEWDEHGVELRQGDFNDATLLESAFSGTDRILVIATDEMSTPGLRVTQHANAIATAKKVGVKHLAYTSMFNPEPGTPVFFLPDHYATEGLIEESGLPHSLLRHGWYLDNLLASLPAIVATRKWHTSAGDGRAAYIAREDAAKAAAAILLADAPPLGRLDIVGQPMTVGEMAAIVSEVFAIAIEVVQLSDEALKAGLEAAGVPPAFAGIAVAVDANTRMDRADVTSDAFLRLTGAPPQSLKSFIAAHRDEILAQANALG